jgi:putative adhesin
MKRKQYLKRFTVGIIFVAQMVLSQNNGTEQITVPLSHSNEPGLLIINHFKGSIDVTGYDGDLVVVKAKLRYPVSGQKTGKMKHISSNSIQLSATEKNNEVTIKSNSMVKTIDLEITIPEKFSLRIQNQDNGDITVENLSGEMDISNINGDINLNNISGTALLNTVDGNIGVRFNDVTPNVPMAFTTIEGNVDITFPEDVSVMLKMKSEHGEIFSDFDIDIKNREQKTEKSSKTGSVKVYLEEWISGKINSGGPEILIKSFEGNVFIRKN